MSRRVPVFNVGMCEEFDQTGICLYDIVRTSDGASIAMDIESLDQDELRRSVILDISAQPRVISHSSLRTWARYVISSVTALRF